VKLFYSDTFELPLPTGHRFPMAKYRLLRERIEAARPFGAELRVPAAATDEQLGLVHTADYIHRVVHGQLDDLEIRRIGFPWSERMVERSRRSVGASIEAGKAALDDGLAVNLAGGTHHAMPDGGQGYCVFNDVAVAARVLQKAGRVQDVLFIDLDVHQGNGTAAIAAGDPTLFAFSIHCGKNFPFRKAAGDLDVELPEGTGDAAYLNALATALETVRSRFAADLVFYLAGADPYAGDRLGRLALSMAGLRERDRMVFEFCRREALPCAVSMSGGYARNVDEIVAIHFATVMTALEFHQQLAPAGDFGQCG
jgi:acetoin utilization deacetylase AcuC-like enzyme